MIYAYSINVPVVRATCLNITVIIVHLTVNVGKMRWDVMATTMPVRDLWFVATTNVLLSLLPSIESQMSFSSSTPKLAKPLMSKGQAVQMVQTFSCGIATMVMLKYSDIIMWSLCQCHHLMPLCYQMMPFSSFSTLSRSRGLNSKVLGLSSEGQTL